MLKIFFESFKIANKSIILATPLIVFCTLFGIYYNYLSEATDTIPKHIFAIITVFVVVSGLMGSWLYSVKKGLVLAKQVYLFDHERNKALLSIFPYLLKGFGRLFLPLSGYLALNILIFTAIFSAVAFLTTTYPELKLHTNLIWLIFFYITTFFTVLWIPEIVYNEKNALYALCNSIIKLFTHFKESFILYIFILAISSVIITLLFKYIFVHPIISFALMLVAYYVILYIVVLLFTYYEKQFLKSEK